MSDLSYRTRVEGFSVELLKGLYDVSGYSDINGRISFSLSRPQKARKLREELDAFASAGQKNDIVAKTRADIARATKAELALVQSGFNVVIENGEIEVSSSLTSEEDIDVIAEYFKIYVVDIIGLQGGEYYE